MQQTDPNIEVLFSQLDRIEFTLRANLALSLAVAAKRQFPSEDDWLGVNKLMETAKNPPAVRLGARRPVPAPTR